MSQEDAVAAAIALALGVACGQFLFLVGRLHGRRQPGPPDRNPLLTSLVLGIIGVFGLLAYVVEGGRDPLWFSLSLGGFLNAALYFQHAWAERRGEPELSFGMNLVVTFTIVAIFIGVMLVPLSEGQDVVGPRHWS